MTNIQDTSNSKRSVKKARSFEEIISKKKEIARAEKRRELKAKIQAATLIMVYLIALLTSRSSPVISAILATSLAFFTLVLVNIKDGKIDLNNIHRQEGFGCGVYVFLSFFIPLYYGIYLGYEDKKFESFLVRNECKRVESNTSEVEYYCSKPSRKITRSFYDYANEKDLKLNPSWDW